MWDKLNKVSVQVTVAVLSVAASYGLLYLIAFKEIPQNNRDLFNVLVGAVVGSSLSAVVGWLYTQSKHNTKPPNTP